MDEVEEFDALERALNCCSSFEEAEVLDVPERALRCNSVSASLENCSEKEAVLTGRLCDTVVALTKLVVL